MNDENPQKEKQYDECIKISLNICSLLFAITGPLLFFIAPFSFMVFDKPTMSNALGFFIIACFFLTPILMIICGCKMWSCYKCKQYKKSIMFCCIPLPILLFLFSI